MTTRQVASILYEIQTLLDLKGEEEFKSKAYGRAARSLETSNVDIGEAVRAGTVASIVWLRRQIAGAAGWYGPFG